MVQALLTHKKWGEYARFVVTGVANTAIDFGVFNGLLLFAGGAVGRAAYTAFKSISFCVAVANSYFFNSRWVFRREKAKRRRKEKALFFAASGMGFLLNISVSLAAFSLMNLFFPNVNISWTANIGAALGVVATNIWNFVIYKFFVFRESAF